MKKYFQSTSSLRATNNADKFSAWARWASNLSSSEDNTQKRMSESEKKKDKKKMTHFLRSFKTIKAIQQCYVRYILLLF